MPAWRANAAAAAQFLQYAALAYTLVGDRALRALSIVPPPWLAQALGNKLVFIGAYFGLSMLATNLTSTGAFEVYLGSTLVYSGVANKGAVPHPDYLAHLLTEAGLV